MPFILLNNFRNHRKTDLNKWHQHVTDFKWKEIKAGQEIKSQVITFCEIITNNLLCIYYKSNVMFEIV